MGILHKLFGAPEWTLNAPVAGETVPVTEVPDPTFSGEMLGKGVAIRPAENVIVSPCDGVVELMFDTGHGVSIKSEWGAEILIHVGLDTVNLKGKYFTIRAKTGDTVRAGQPLIEFDRAAIAAAGYDTITPIVICNSSDFGTIRAETGKTVAAGDPVLHLAH